jgi:hypothetical protein
MFVGIVSDMVTCRLVIRCWVLIYHFIPAKRTNNSSGVNSSAAHVAEHVFAIQWHHRLGYHAFPLVRQVLSRHLF